jgi:hypothetical protein
VAKNLFFELPKKNKSPWNGEKCITSAVYAPIAFFVFFKNRDFKRRISEMVSEEIRKLEKENEKSGKNV